MQSTLNTELLATMLKSKRGEKPLRTVAEEIGEVSVPTLSRIEQGSIPDVATFIKLCKWLHVPADTFIISESGSNATSIKEQVVASLRAEKDLSPDTIKMLIHLIDLAYQKKG